MKVGFTCGAFDLCHAGHILMFKEAKTQCDHLIVGLQTDPTIDRPEKNKPLQSLPERHLQLSAIKYIDEIITYETEDDLYKLLMALDPDVRILSEEYKEKHYTGKQLNQPTYYNKRRHQWSSSELRKRINDL